jgi:hypothetical protein
MLGLELKVQRRWPVKSRVTQAGLSDSVCSAARARAAAALAAVVRRGPRTQAAVHRAARPGALGWQRLRARASSGRGEMVGRFCASSIAIRRMHLTLV